MFDWYEPKYELRQDYREVVRLVASMHLEDVNGGWGVATATAKVALIVRFI